jgi:hypothetical protein
VLSISALAIGVVAIGLASIPPVILGRALPNPFVEEKAKDKPRVEQATEREGGITLKYKNFSVNVGGRVPEKKNVGMVQPESAKDPIRWFTISAVSFALVGIVVSLIGHWREKHTVLTVGSVGCCAAAIAWQYLAVGIAIGAAAAAFIIVLALIGSVLN